MKFREILDTINESILKIVSTKDVEKKDNLIVNTTAGINVIITDYPLTKEQKKILTSIMTSILTDCFNLVKTFNRLDKKYGNQTLRREKI